MIAIPRFLAFATVLLATKVASGFSFSFRGRFPTTAALRSQSTAQTDSSTVSSKMLLRDKYFDRLGFTDDEAGSFKPNKANLDRIIEAHLANVTFDNLAQHGLPYTASLEVEKTTKKVLDERRGGFCFELNGLLGEFLLDLGYSVKRIPAIVNTGGGFHGLATHVVLVVSAPEENNDKEYYVDVGFGEPPINALHYQLHTEQETPEGMVSRFMQCEEDPEAVILEWKQGDEWLPRLKWLLDHPDQDLHLFQEGLDAVLVEGSIFDEKLIVCKVDRKEKISLAGNRLKVTSPRFGADSQITVEELASLEAVQKVLEERFNIPSAEKLSLKRSLAADSELWTQM